MGMGGDGMFEWSEGRKKGHSLKGTNPEVKTSSEGEETGKVVSLMRKTAMPEG